MSGTVQQKTVVADEDGVRLDRWFARHFPQVNNIRLQKLLRTGQVRVDGKRADGKTRVQAGQVVRVPPLPAAIVEEDKPKKTEQKKSSITAKQLKAMVLYDDDDVVIINKPPGLAVQGGTGIAESLDDVLAFFRQGKDKPRLVHRLDKETSGVLVIARTVYAATRLAQAFRDRTTQKFYLAVLQACPRPRKAQIDAPLLKLPDKKAGGKMVVDPHGDEATTMYRTLVKAPNGMTLALLKPHTGRTHQLRVHMAHIGTPIVGDPLYNPASAGEGLHLHAARILIPHPRDGYGFLDVTAPLPELQADTWHKLGFDTARDWTDDEE
jgi:23S rRNA pseudouridine955/2504/2580 synthase